MALPTDMLALTLVEDGYSGKAEGPSIAALEPYLELRSVLLPQPGAGQVLVRMALASVNPSDVHFIKGEYGQPRISGTAAGFEGVGDVVLAGDPDNAGLVGTRVAFASGRSGTGTWAQYAVADAAGCIPVRSDMRDTDAAGHIVNPLSALAMVDIARRSEARSLVLTAGASQLSKLMIALCRDHDIAAIAIVRRSSQAEALLQLGAAAVLDETAGDFGERLKEAIAAHKPRFLFDAVAGQFSADIFAAMPNRARWIVYGKLATMPPSLTEPGQLIFMGKSIEGFWLTNWFAQASPQQRLAAITETQERFVDGRWTTDIAAIVALDKAMQELPEALRIRDGKVFLKP
jgi:NADPH:quinone reductase-like Zn-dependent oxidoreductase